MKNIRLFETEQEFLNDPIEREYPTVSYIKDIDSVHYEEKASPCVYLPCIDTTRFATEFIEGEYYPQEALAFKVIAEMHPRDREDLYISYSDNGQYVLHNYDHTLEFDITNEPMVLNWISLIDVAKLPIGIVDYTSTPNVYLNLEDRGWSGTHWTQINFEDGRCFHNAEGGVGGI